MRLWEKRLNSTHNSPASLNSQPSTDVIQKFLDYIAIEKRYSPRTVGEYHDDLCAWCEFLGTDMEHFSPQEVTDYDVRQWMIHMLDAGQSPRSVKRRLSALRSFYKFMLRVGIVDVDITRTVITPKADKPLPVFFRESEMENFKHLSSNEFYSDEEDPIKRFEALRNYLIIEMLYQTGMRRAEIIGLSDKDVDTSQAQIRVFGKRRKERIVPIGDGLIKTINDYRQSRQDILEVVPTDGTFFVQKHRNGEWYAMTAATLYNIVRARMGEVSTLKKHSPHVLRHTFATTMLNNGADIRTIQSLLGHASLAATQVYTHTTFEQIQRAYNAAHPRSNKNNHGNQAP